MINTVSTNPPELDPLAQRPSASLAPISRAPARGRISDRVSEELTAAIRDLRLAPGAVVSETDLAARLGVSRTPLREAISRLVDHGLLSVVAQVGTRVSLIDLREVEQAVFIRCALETAAFREACTLDPPDVTVLRQILDRQEQAQAEHDVAAFFDTDEELHQEIFRLGRHPEVWSVVRRTKLQLDRLRRVILPEAIATRSLIDEHQQIVSLLERRDVEAGVELVTLHARHVLDDLPEIRSHYPAYFTA
jgi:GntR family transcriptional regulator, rspAB operon transcriptional repressor